MLGLHHGNHTLKGRENLGLFPILKFAELVGELFLQERRRIEAPQEARVDLSAYTGTQPVDLFSQDQAAPVGHEPYALRLEGYGYRWLRLA